MSRLRRALAAVQLIALAASVGCSSVAGTRSAPSPPPIEANVYVAVGASETVGVGSDHPERDAWPQVFYRSALPTGAIFYNLGEPGVTTAEAAARELPAALSVQPDLVTVWLNVDDLLHEVPAAAYEAQLDRLVGQLRRGGRARVLVANTPVVDGLPAYRDCLAQVAGSRCLIRDRPAPAPDDIRRRVDAYNQAIVRVVERQGAILVDLHCSGDMASTHPDWVGNDGFHPGTLGHAAIARAFAAAARGRSCSMG